MEGERKEGNPYLLKGSSPFAQVSRLKVFSARETIDPHFVEVKKTPLYIPISLKEVALSALPKK